MAAGAELWSTVMSDPTGDAMTPDRSLATSPEDAPTFSPPPPAGPSPSGLDERGHVRRTKTSAIWVGLIAAAIVLIALLIFIGQNSNSVTVHYLGAHGRVPLAVALLLSAVAGLLIAAIPGTVRILQLRRSLKKNAQAQIGPGRAG
jgi:uncharacterized integral membrane protein